MVEPAIVPRVVRDADDDQVIAAALAAQADLIDDVLGCGHKNSEIFKFTGYSNDVCYTFFCIVCGDKTLNLQFNENYKTQ